jgi:hypothetical protein
MYIKPTGRPLEKPYCTLRTKRPGHQRRVELAWNDCNIGLAVCRWIGDAMAITVAKGTLSHHTVLDAAHVDAAHGQEHE